MNHPPVASRFPLWIKYTITKFISLPFVIDLITRKRWRNFRSLVFVYRLHHYYKNIVGSVVQSNLLSFQIHSYDLTEVNKTEKILLISFSWRFKTDISKARDQYAMFITQCPLRDVHYTMSITRYLLRDVNYTMSITLNSSAWRELIASIFHCIFHGWLNKSLDYTHDIYFQKNCRTWGST